MEIALGPGRGARPTKEGSAQALLARAGVGCTCTGPAGAGGPPAGSGQAGGAAVAGRLRRLQRQQEEMFVSLCPAQMPAGACLTFCPTTRVASPPRAVSFLVKDTRVLVVPGHQPVSAKLGPKPRPMASLSERWDGKGWAGVCQDPRKPLTPTQPRLPLPLPCVWAWLWPRSPWKR